MDPAVCERVGLNSRNQATAYLAKGNVGRAFAHFLVALKLNPDWKEELKSCFLKTLKTWGEDLEESGRIDDLFKCYEQAIEVCPEYENVFKELGNFLLRLNLPNEATNYFRKYLALNPWDIQGIYLLENTCNLVVERWHFRMLNDEHRNEAFREAIVKKVRQGFHPVLDIGTGSGILSLFAVEGGAENVFACDASSTMTTIAKQVLEHQGVTNVKVLNKHSTDLKVPEDLPSTVKLIVCEIMDSGLLGEQVLQTLVHARRHLLHPDGIILPLGASFHLCGIQAPQISRDWNVHSFPAGLGLEDFILTPNTDEYETEDLNILPDGYKKVTDVSTTLLINFNDVEEMEDVLAGNMDCTVTLKSAGSGKMHCVMGWFSLRLDEDITLDTGPESAVKCWDQAIFPCLPPIILHKDEEVNLKVSFKTGKVTVDVVKEDLRNSINVSQRLVKMLNDTRYVECLESTSATLASTRLESCHVLDTSPFPLFGMRFLMLRSSFADRLLCTYSTIGEKELIEQTAKKCGIASRVLSISADVLQDFIDCKQKFDIILLNVVDETGELSESTLSKMTDIRNCVKPGGVILPEDIEIMGQFVESEWLQGVSKILNEEVTCSYLIAPFVNMFKVDHHICFRLRSISAKERSEVVNLLQLNLADGAEMIESKTCVKTSMPGQVTALVYWFNLIFLKSSTSTTFSTINSVSLYNQAAFLFDFKTEESLMLETKYQRGLFRTRRQIK